MRLLLLLLVALVCCTQAVLAKKKPQKHATSKPTPAPAWALLGSGVCEQDELATDYAVDVTLATCEASCTARADCVFFSVVAGTSTTEGFCRMYGEFTSCTARVTSGLLSLYTSYQSTTRLNWGEEPGTGDVGVCSGEQSYFGDDSLADCMGICIASSSCYAISTDPISCYIYDAAACASVYHGDNALTTYFRATRNPA